jgi:hypothetical protein
MEIKIRRAVRRLCGPAGVTQLGLLFVLVVAGVTNVRAQITIPLDRKVGDLFAATGAGSYHVYTHTALSPDYVLADPDGTIFDGFVTDNTAGCGFDLTYHPFTTGFTTDLTANRVFRDAIDNPQTPIRTIPVAHGGAQPTSITFDSQGNSYIGMAGGNGLIQEYSPSGTFVRTLPVLPPNTTSLSGGTPYMDLSPGGQIVYFTNSSNNINQLDISSNKITKFAGVGSGTAYGLSVLTPAAQAATASFTGGPGLLLVAVVSSSSGGSSGVQLFNAKGNSIKTYTVAGENNFQVLALHSNGTAFLVGSPTTHNVYLIDLASGAVQDSVNVGSTGPSGLCVYGAFRAAQLPSLAVAKTTVFQPITVTAALTPGGSTNNTTCTAASGTNTMDCTFTTSVPDVTQTSKCLPAPTESTNVSCFSITLNGINLTSLPTVADKPTLQLVYNYTQIPQAAGTSDTSPPLACSLTSPDGTKCEVHSVDVTPNNGSSDGSIYQGFDLATFSTQSVQTNPSVLNPVMLKNELHELTDFIVHGTISLGGSDKTKSIFTLNEQPIQVAGSQSCGYTSPLLNSQFNQGRTIPFKFQAVSPPNTCASGPNFLTTLHPRLVLVQLNNLSTFNAAPHRVDFFLSDGTPCTESTPCFYSLSTTTWILNVSTKNLQGAVNNVPTSYLGTTIDDSNQIPSFSSTAASGAPDIFSVQ